jgi:hypothetical protein
VRESVTSTITLPRNDTDKAVTVAPVVTHPYWTGPSVVEIPARGTATCTLTYKPMTMTREEQAAAAAASAAA